MKVLVDRNIERNAVTHKTVNVEKTSKWGRQKTTSLIASRLARPPRLDEQFRIEQLPYLASICIFAKTGKLEFFTSQEIRMEGYRQKSGGKGYLGINLLDGVPIKCVPCPIDRPLTISAGGSIGVTEDEQMEFFRSIANPRFVTIAKAVGANRIDDAYHLWTAEEAHLDAFLTMDKKFRDATAKHHVLINSPVQVMTPRDLAECLSLQPADIEAIARSINPFS